MSEDKKQEEYRRRPKVFLLPRKVGGRWYWLSVRIVIERSRLKTCSTIDGSKPTKWVAKVWDILEVIENPYEPLEAMDFPQRNMEIAKDQPEYRTLPAYIEGSHTIFCWKLSWRDRLNCLIHGRIWHRVLKHPSAGLRPQMITTDSPFNDEAE